MKKILLLLLFLVITIFKNFSQENYYYYKGKKISLEIDDKKIKVWTDKNFDESELNSLNLNISSIKETKNNAKEVVLEYDENLKDKKNEIIKELLKSKQIKAFSNFYKRKNSSSISTSNIFYVKLKNENDLSLLEEVSNNNSVNILHRNKFMPKWYTLSISNKKSSVELTNIFYETGLFSEVDPAFMFNFNKNCTNDTNFSQLWGLNNSSNSNIDINACDAWNITTLQVIILKLQF